MVDLEKNNNPKMHDSVDENNSSWVAKVKVVLETNGGETCSKKTMATSNTVCNAGKLICGDLVLGCLF